MPMYQWKFSLTPADRKRLQQLQRALDRPSEADALRTVLRQRWEAEVMSGGISKAEEREIRREERQQAQQQVQSQVKPVQAGAATATA